MQPECLVKLHHEWWRDDANPPTKTFDGDGTDLLGLSLRVARETGVARFKKDLEGVKARDVRSHRHHRNDAVPQSPQ